MNFGAPLKTSRFPEKISRRFGETHSVRKFQVFGKEMVNNHKLDGIGVERTDPVYDSVAHDPVKTMLSEAEAEEPTNHEAQNRKFIVIGLFFRFCLRLRQRSFHLILNDGVISMIIVLFLTPSVGFSLDRIPLRF